MSIKKIIQSYDPTIPLARAWTIPSSWYIDPDIAEVERKTVFSRSWQVAGRAEQLQTLGQYVTCHIAGEPVVIVRGTDGGLRGFFNVCRHHAAAVMTESCGEADQLRCPYHGWTYSLNGELKSAPDLGAVVDFDRSVMGLVPVEVALWGRWVLTKLEPGDAPLESITGLRIDHFQWFERRHYTLECNWKVFVDNYLDGGYHVPQLHKNLDSILDYADYKIETGERSCLQSSPVATGGQALYYWIYPNFMINRYEDAMDTNLVIPRGVDRTDVVFDFYFTDVSEAARSRNLASVGASDRIQQEDTAICKSVQRGLASRAYDAGRLSAREAGEHLFHRLLYADLSRSGNAG
ncbi:MAG TPA: aromatic ring-hydroxylating dioxygenase subunit alpha [Terriglobia bacterium]|nr:aromatic ring-hydroxylating dioxygenase subunit alpha [Terriglobia bacterium]